MRVAFIESGLCRSADERAVPEAAVLESMARAFPSCRFDVIVRKKNTLASLSRLDSLPNVGICLPENSLFRLSSFLWSRVWLKRQLKACRPDIVHVRAENLMTDTFDGMPRFKCVVSVRDLGFLSAPTGYSWLQRHRYNLRTAHLCRIADVIIVPDSGTAAALVKYYFISRTRIKVIGDDVAESAPDCISAAVMSVYESLVSC